MVIQVCALCLVSQEDVRGVWGSGGREVEYKYVSCVSGGREVVIQVCVLCVSGGCEVVIQVCVLCLRRT